MILFVFFKQKTAYEMRISDWSSDVCSSDLSGPMTCQPSGSLTRCLSRPWAGGSVARCDTNQSVPRVQATAAVTRPATGEARVASTVTRSEEHTSELQSLMRISYAVFCLKKKKK